MGAFTHKTRLAKRRLRPGAACRSSPQESLLTACKNSITGGKQPVFLHCFSFLPK
jgi:hypothetical protein